MKNILSVDIEEWYCDLPTSRWGEHEFRVAGPTRRILRLLKETGNKATFFVLGHVAEHCPELVLEIRNQGHEISTHGYWHRRITDQTPEEFEKDLVKALRLIKKITGDKILGYRAPQFTVMEKTSYVIDILKKHGLIYDSSVFPAKTPLYGVPSAPMHPYKISSGNIAKNGIGEEFTEIPISVYEIPLIKKRVPLIGGVYFRFFPYFLTKYAIKKINKKNKPAVFYTHPWEYDPGKPKISGLGWNHYYGLKRSERKLRKLLKDHKFISIRDWLKENGNPKSKS